MKGVQESIRFSMCSYCVVHNHDTLYKLKCHITFLVERRETQSSLPLELMKG